jgi:tRNA-splicing ligase RtcB
MSRGEAHKKLDQRKVDEQYRRDGIQVNLDGEVPLDESGACYKSADEVVAAVTAAGLARIDRTLWPLSSIKGNDSPARAQKRERKAQERSRAQDLRSARRSKRS